MKLIDHNLKEFADVLASEAPAPGGGSTAALEGSLGAALIHMVAALTSGKAKFAEHQELMTSLLAESEKIKNEFVAIIDRDTEAFNSVTAVFEMPKSTDEDKAARKKAMQEALKACTISPYSMMEQALAALELAEKAIGKTNPNAASDFGVAALSLKAATQGAWLNILINVPGIDDKEFVEKYKGGGEKILAKATKLADEIYAGVLTSLS
ncbi:sugar ABC transporter substrate-binding protein [Deltaproteobacteria bacterium Smac51]|nr:sugar ABC transporter substrate-binding protein [Deltaproteobacteria bacterium Smac51]